MPEGNDCPECGKSIGMGPVFKAPVPNRIYCPHCKARLRYGGTGGLIAAASLLTVLLVLAAGAVGLALFWAIESIGLAALAAIVFVIVGGGLLEVVFVMILWYGSYQLEPVNRPTLDDYEF